MWLYCGNLLSGCPIVVKWYFSKFFPAVLAAHHIIFSHFSPKQFFPILCYLRKEQLAGWWPKRIDGEKWFGTIFSEKKEKHPCVHCSEIWRQSSLIKFWHWRDCIHAHMTAHTFEIMRLLPVQETRTREKLEEITAICEILSCGVSVCSGAKHCSHGCGFICRHITCNISNLITHQHYTTWE